MGDDRDRAEEFDAVVVDVRLPPGDDPYWKELHRKAGRDKVHAELGLQLLRWLLESKDRPGLPAQELSHLSGPVLYDGRIELVLAEENPELTLRSTLELAGLSSDAIVSIYYGAEKTASDAQPVAAELEGAFPGIQVDLIEGGQPHHQYLASVE